MTSSRSQSSAMLKLAADREKKGAANAAYSLLFME
jgi:hypothetical protein